MSDEKDILLLNLTRMGDMIQSTPLAVGLKKRNPGASIVVCAAREFVPAARLMDGVDEVISLDYEGLRGLARDGSASILRMVSSADRMLDPLLSRRFRMAVNLTHSVASYVLMYLIDARDKRGAQMTDTGHRFIAHPWMLFFHYYAHNRQITPYNLVDLYALGGDVPLHRDRIPLSIRVPADAEAWAGEFLLREAGGDGPLVAVQAGASDAHKMWHPSSFIRLCRILRDACGARFLFVGGAGERELAERIHAVVDAPGSVVAAGCTDLPRLAAVLRRCDLMITNDTGPMHLAAAVGTRVLSFALGPVYYSNTGPYGDGHIVFQPKAPCAPCAFDVRCVNPECKSMVTPEAVALIAARVLRNEPVTPGCIPDGPAFAGCDVYRSGWGEDGLMDYRPVLCRPEPARQRLRSAYRRIWGDVLLYGKDPPGGDLPVPPEGDGLFSCLREVERRAAEGVEAARGVLGRCADPAANLPALNAGIATIQKCSRRIRELGVAVPEANGLCQMFGFEEENMKSVDLEGAARENVLIFQNLLGRTRSLAHLLAGERPTGARAPEGRRNECI